MRCMSISAGNPQSLIMDRIQWQAHRGGGAHEAPENTMEANRYTWSLGGIPEADIRTTKDGVIICLHDDTLARTTNAPEAIRHKPVSEMLYKEIRQWNAGIHFTGLFSGGSVPAVENVFAEMSGNPDLKIYLDLKQVDLTHLGQLIEKYGVNEQVIFTHHLQDNCKKMKLIANQVKSMLWIGGSSAQIRERFELALATGFSGLDQVQLHLNEAKNYAGSWRYEVDSDYLQYALNKTAVMGVDLEVLPFCFEQEDIHRLLELGIGWFATDEPSRFLEAVKSWNTNGEVKQS